MKNKHEFQLGQKENQQYIDYYEYAKGLFDSHRHDPVFLDLFDRHYCYEQLFMPQCKDLSLIKQFLNFVIDYINEKSLRQQQEYELWQHEQQMHQAPIIQSPSKMTYSREEDKSASR